ncbi:MAG: Dabb family protein [Candidatus Omnitrophica bacterium]|nr:Dabb family protein [Candidatus Omnitrophota bacterium]
MIKHIVIWNLKENVNGNSKQANAQMLKEKLEVLQGRIPGLLNIEVGIDFSLTLNSGDIVLYSEFISKEALAEYQIHHEHKAVGLIVGELCSARHVVDYEIN